MKKFHGSSVPRPRMKKKIPTKQNLGITGGNGDRKTEERKMDVKAEVSATDSMLVLWIRGSDDFTHRSCGVSGRPFIVTFGVSAETREMKTNTTILWDAEYRNKVFIDFKVEIYYHWMFVKNKSTCIFSYLVIKLSRCFRVSYILLYTNFFSSVHPNFLTHYFWYLTHHVIDCWFFLHLFGLASFMWF